MKFADVRGRYGTVRGVCNGCRYNRVMIQSISHERTRVMWCQLRRRRRYNSSVWQFSIAKAEKERERDNCDYCEFSGARNYVNEVEKRAGERVKGWKYCNVLLLLSAASTETRGLNGPSMQFEVLRTTTLKAAQEYWIRKWSWVLPRQYFCSRIVPQRIYCIVAFQR